MKEQSKEAISKQQEKTENKKSKKRLLDPEESEIKRFPFWRTLLPYMKPYRRNIVFAVILAMVTGLCVAAQPLMIKYIVDTGLGDTPLTFFGKEILVFDGQTAFSERMRFILILAGVYMIFSFGRIYSWRYGYKNSLKVQEGALFTLRSKFFGHVQRMCMHFRDKNSAGELYNYIMGSPMANIKAFLQAIVQTVPYQIFSLVISLVLLFSYNVWLTLLVVGASLFMALCYRFSAKKIRTVSRRYLDTEKETSHYVTDVLHGGEATKMYAIEDATISSFEDRIDKLKNTGMQASMTNLIETAHPELLQYGCTALVYLVGGFFCLRGDVGVGEFYMFLSTMSTILAVILSWLNLGLTQKNAATVALARIDRIIAEHSTTPEVAENARRSIVIEKASAQRRGKPCIAFRDVTFGYDTKPIFSHLNCEMRYGESIALVGGSGSGKSTFTKLVMRLYEVGEGEILMHDRNIKDFDSHELRVSFGVVPQNPYIFYGTIWDNIRIVRPDATNFEIIQAMELARVHEFVNDLPKGWSTVVGDGALGLSGGQKQRIAIARAILKKPDIFIFDEATSALDNLSERLIQAAMEDLMKDHAVIFVAHRLSTIRNVNRILVFDHGRIVEEGSYDELASQNGEFRRLLDAAEGAVSYEKLVSLL